MFKKFSFFFPHIKKYIFLTLIVFALNILLSLLSTASVAIILPVMRFLFDDSTVSSGSQDILKNIHQLGFLENIKVKILSSVQGFIIAPNDKHQSLINLSFLVISIFILKNFVKYVAYVLNTFVDENILKSAKDSLYEMLVNLPLSFHNNTKSGELINLVNNDIPTANGALITSISTLIRLPVEILTSLFLLLSFSPFLTLLSFSTSILSVLVIRFLRVYIKRYSGRIQDGNVNMLSNMQETFQNIRIVKAYANEIYEVKRFTTLTSSYVRNILKYARVVNLNSPTSEIFAIVALMFVLYAGGNMVIKNELKADELITFLFILFSMMQPITNLLSIPANIQRGEVSAERINNFIENIQPMKNGDVRINEFKNKIEFKNVSFEYLNGNPIIKDFCLEINKHETVALVGSSGGGKSTIMDLLQRHYDVATGEILIDGQNIKSLDLQDYRKLFGVVTQDPILFNDTIKSNIRYSKLNSTDSEVIQSAKIANADDFISQATNGYDTLIGERGVLLSGGQKQRIAIARAINCNPQILLFDEATSALDTESEALVQSAINNLLKDRTALVIAHRLSTIKNANKIVVIENGQIAEQGNHEYLLSINGIYSKLFNLQFRNS